MCSWAGFEASGRPTFWDDPPLAPGATRALESTWLPLWGLGALSTAGPDGVLGLLPRDDGGLTVTLATPRILPNTSVVVSLDGRVVFRTAPLNLRPDLPLAIELPPGSAGRVQVEAAGMILQAP